ncbi:hypothetical protein HZS_6681, partial [Henneguya salminicola]
MFYHWISSHYKSSLFHAPYWRYFKSTPILNYEIIIHQYFTDRKNSVSTIISNCGLFDTFRLDYIDELKAYYPIDSFGACFHTKITPHDREYYIRKNKFYLSFENTLCLDYITEKYWQVLNLGAIPIVMGYGKKLTGLIPDSYINVFDFESPKALSEYLNFVSNNETEFKRYHVWRNSYGLSPNNYESDGCGALSIITKSLQGGITEDKTVHFQKDKSLCLSTNDVKNSLLKTTTR